MAELENLEIVIDVIDSFSDELNRLLAKLVQVETAVQAVDDIRIDVDVRGEHEIDALLAKLGALEAADLSGVGNIDVGGRGGGGGATTTRIGTSQFDRLDRLMSTQVAQMGRMIQSFDGLDADTRSLRRSFGNTMSAADKAADSLELSNIRMSDMHNAMARLLPLLGVFIGTIPIVIGALAALAAAAVAATVALASMTVVGGLGAAMARGDGNIMEGMSDILSELREDFIDAFRPLMDAFSPLIEDAIDGIGRLFQEIANFGDIFRGLSDEARAFGSFMSEFIQGTARDMALMTEAFAPIFGMIGDFLSDMDLMENLSNLMADVLPEMIIFTGLIIGLIQRLVEMSKGFLDVAVVIGIVLSLIARFLNFIGLTDKRLGVLIASILTVASAYWILTSSLWSAVIPALTTLGTKILAMISTYTSYSASTIVAALANYGLATSFIALVGAVTLGIGALLAVGGITAALSKGFGGLSGNIDSATESLRNFRRQQRRMDEGDNPYRNPDIRRGQNFGESRFSGGGGVSVTVEGDADEEAVRNQTQNALYRMERPGRQR